MLAANNPNASEISLCERIRSELQAKQNDSPVEVIETHISWVFLTSRWALKLKKPVKFDFLDFSTVDRRRNACEDEVRLNRRLASDVYVEVLPVVSDEHDHLYFEEKPDGKTIDWLVKMRRLPAAHSLDRMIKAHEVTSYHIENIAQTLEKFYLSLPFLDIPANTYRDRLESHVQNNRNALLGSKASLETARIKRIHASQLQFLQLSTETFEHRAGSHIVDGHGDLRPEHIYIAPDPVVIDCIEFNAEMRQVDVADELAFLEMECELQGATDVGRRIAEACLNAMDDDPPPELISFYKSYRGCVRAKVAALRSEQVDSDKASSAVEESLRYLSLADRHAVPLGTPFLGIVRGLMGTGKSTLATDLARSLGAELLQTDVIRREWFTASDPETPYGEGVYAEDHRQKVYDELFLRAAKALYDGIPVVLDGTFLTVKLRQRAASLAAEHDAGFWIVNCRCPDDVARERIARRQSRGDSVSEARPELLDQQRAEEEPISPDQPQWDADTTLDPHQLKHHALEYFRRGFP